MKLHEFMLLVVSEMLQLPGEGLIEINAELLLHFGLHELKLAHDPHDDPVAELILVGETEAADRREAALVDRVIVRLDIARVAGVDSTDLRNGGSAERHHVAVSAG